MILFSIFTSENRGVRLFLKKANLLTLFSPLFTPYTFRYISRVGVHVNARNKNLFKFFTYTGKGAFPASRQDNPSNFLS
jgi:hypothetical protein